MFKISINICFMMEHITSQCLNSTSVTVTYPTDVYLLAYCTFCCVVVTLIFINNFLLTHVLFYYCYLAEPANRLRTDLKQLKQTETVYIAKGMSCFHFFPAIFPFFSPLNPSSVIHFYLYNITKFLVLYCDNQFRF